MEAILQSILEVSGVSAALVVEGAGQLVCHRGHAIYDRALCEQLGRTVARAADTIQLQQEDWDSVSAQYADGKLLLRNLGSAGGTPRILAVVADATLNPSFATVAIRVAANKLKKAAGGAGSSVVSATPPPLPSSAARSTAAPAPTPADSRPVLANTGLSWSSSSSSSSVGVSRIAVADAASGAFLSKAAKELARHVGPMAKVYVEEGVRRVCPDAPFALAAAPRLIEDLAGQIEDGDDRKQFVKSVEKL